MNMPRQGETSLTCLPGSVPHDWQPEEAVPGAEAGCVRQRGGQLQPGGLGEEEAGHRAHQRHRRQQQARGRGAQHTLNIMYLLNCQCITPKQSCAPYQLHLFKCLLPYGAFLINLSKDL